MELLLRLRPDPFSLPRTLADTSLLGKDGAGGNESRGTRAERGMKEGEDGRGEERRRKGRRENREEEKDRGRGSRRGESVLCYPCGCKYLLFCLSG